MDAVHVTYLPETPAYDLDIEAINAEAFGPGRFARAAYAIREGGPMSATFPSSPSPSARWWPRCA